MPEYIALERADSDSDDLDPLQWSLITAPATEDVGVVWTCPEGHQNSLKGYHDIENLGLVDPRAHCHEEDCGFVHHVKLDAWKPETTPS